MLVGILGEVQSRAQALKLVEAVFDSGVWVSMLVGLVVDVEG